MIRLYGGQTIGFIHQDNKIQTYDEYTAVHSSGNNLSWTYTTGLLSNFEDQNLNGGNIDLDEVIESWRIYRRKSNETQDTYITSVDSHIRSFIDYMVANNETYIWTIFPSTENYIGSPIYSQETSVFFKCWSLTDTVTHDVYLFKLGLNNGEIESNFTVNSNKSIISVNDKYPVISQGLQKYYSASLTALIGDINSYNQYANDTIEKRNNIIAFLNNGNRKIYKNIRGDMLLVDTTTNEFIINNKLSQSPQSISFSIIEVGDIADINVFDEVLE